MLAGHLSKRERAGSVDSSANARDKPQALALLERPDTRDEKAYRQGSG